MQFVAEDGKIIAVRGDDQLQGVFCRLDLQNFIFLHVPGRLAVDDDLGVITGTVVYSGEIGRASCRERV